MFSFVAAVCYGATAIACAVYARAWGQPPTLCHYYDYECDPEHLKGTNGATAVS